MRYPISLLLLLVLAVPLRADVAADARMAMGRGLAYLHATQNPDGSWSPEPGPAITALVLRVMLDQPGASLDEPHTLAALRYVLSKARPDGGIHDGMLENYNTAICLSALAPLKDRPDVAPVVAAAQDYLRRLQWSDQLDPKGNPVNEAHPFYGGAGYGKHGRPDMSNTHFMVQALYDSGLEPGDAAFQRALVFISRCQGLDGQQVITPDGGFIYATSIDSDHIGIAQSMASPELQDEAKLGKPVSGLRTYGSMTYAGFKSYVYAGLTRDDPRVLAAWQWVRAHYTFDRNPGMPEHPEKLTHLQGLFYYYMTMARALEAWGEPKLTLTDGREVLWPRDMITALLKQQRPDGSWVNAADRWMESDPNLVTAYALTAIAASQRSLP